MASIALIKSFEINKKLSPLHKANTIKLNKSNTLSSNLPIISTQNPPCSYMNIFHTTNNNDNPNKTHIARQCNDAAPKIELFHSDFFGCCILFRCGTFQLVFVFFYCSLAPCNCASYTQTWWRWFWVDEYGNSHTIIYVPECISRQLHTFMHNASLVVENAWSVRPRSIIGRLM